MNIHRDSHFKICANNCIFRSLVCKISLPPHGNKKLHSFPYTACLSPSGSWHEVTSEISACLYKNNLKFQIGTSGTFPSS